MREASLIKDGKIYNCLWKPKGRSSKKKTKESLIRDIKMKIINMSQIKKDKKLAKVFKIQKTYLSL